MVRSKRLRDRKRAGSKRRDQAIKSGGRSTIKIPDGVELFLPDDKKYRFDVIPYIVGKGNPFAEEGEIYYERTFWTHRVGADNKYRICPLKTAGKSCPVCEDRAKKSLDPDADEKMVDSLKPSQRQLYLIRQREDDSEMELFEFSWWNFGRLLDDIRQAADEDELHIIDFDDPDAGATLRVLFGKNPPFGMETKQIEFRPRSAPLPDEWLDHGVCLDSLLVIPSYEELKKEYYQIEDEDADVEKPKGKKRSEKPKDDTDDDDDDWGDDDKNEDTKDIEEGDRAIHEDLGLVEVTSINKAKTKAKVEDVDGDTHTIDFDELKPVPDNPCKACGGTGKNSKGGKCSPCKGTGVEQKTEKAKSKTKSKETTKDASDDDWGDDDVPPTKSKSKKSSEPEDGESSSKSSKTSSDDDDDYDDDDDDWG